MPKSPNLMLGAICAIVLAAPAVAEEVTADTVLATVAGKNITLGHIIAARATLPEQYQSAPDDALFEGLLENLIQQAVLAAALEDVPPAITLAAENAARSLEAGAALDAAIKAGVTEEMVKEAYEARIAEFQPQPEFNASHILVPTQEEAAEIKKMVDEGADFAATAMEKSTGPSGPNGGQLGWFGLGMMVPPFEQAVTQLEPGQVSEPVQTQFGWHVILLNETRDSQPPAYADLEGELRADLEQKVVEEYIASLNGSTDVERADVSAIDPSMIRNTDLIEN
ncbi:Foldase protein PrsA 2 precursor [Pseudoruegeria aquimaris]|uniref:Parvulin-like PPIase n=1 Tax=Pseudoruegeria aquimaris TaxID=393663 RepID=A0A1Y5RTR3_9RHOB|nr:peptidylprolyl isomerase [Pseudoruegeria aquimaris]SLN25012.1 Foldase protein PrsA 2 precursor [Pseudoruegeria aquimaris]